MSFRRYWAGLLALGLAAIAAFAQNASTGAVTGTVLDPSGAVITGAQITAASEATDQRRTVATRGDGAFVIPLLPPGKYRLTVTHPGFKTAAVESVAVGVTETVNININLEVGTESQSVEVRAEALQLQTETAQLGSVTTGEMIATLPLVTRNFTQIIALNPGISAEPNNAGDLGHGSGSLGGGGTGFAAHGSATNDNNFQMNGVEMNDTMGSLTNSGGIAVPSPDALQEFKVLTGQYDASYGRNSGANVNIVTKSGANQLHALLFEYFRNNNLNANSWQNNRLGAPRSVLKQNQFGGTLGGPIIKDKLFYFGSYQGTRQRNGISASCSSTIYTPPLTNDRSRQGLGAVFAGQRGYYNDYVYGAGLAKSPVGPAIAADGSNISSVGLALLQAKLPNGNFVIPTPQRIIPAGNPDAAGAFDMEGISALSIPCPFTEDQVVADVDYQQNAKSRFSAKVFWDNSTELLTLRSGAIAGFPMNQLANFRNYSLDHTYTFTGTLLNQATIGYSGQHAGQVQNNSFKFSDFGINAHSVDDPPVIDVGNVGIGGYGQSTVFSQNTFVAQDQISWIHGRHSMRFGGGATHIQINEPGIGYSSVEAFLSTTDALLGLNATDNGMAAIGLPYGNVYEYVEFLGPKAAFYRLTDGNVYAQDDIKVARSLTVNVGFRFERLGDMSQPRGLMTSLDTSLLQATPPAAGTYAGYTVQSNFPGTPPAGVVKENNNLGTSGTGQNTWNPRAGFAWQIPHTKRMVLRGGYGLFHMRTTGQGLIQSVSAPPWAYLQYAAGTPAANATAANPFPATLPTLPYFPPITPTSGLSGFEVLAPDFHPPKYQQYSMGIQTQLMRGLILDVSYVGGHGQDLLEQVFPDGAQLASATSPIRGVTTNTASASNVSARQPWQGFAANGFELIKNGGISWYNSLEVNAVKSMGHGLQFQAAYTFQRDLTDLPGIVSNTIGGSIIGDPNNPRQHYGPDTFIREHRFVFSYLYMVPGPKNLKSFAGELLGGWSLAGVTTAQSGHRLPVTYNNTSNVTGLGRYDRPDITAGCQVMQQPQGYSIQSAINNPALKYFNTGCFAAPANLVAGTTGSYWGDSPFGIVTGPREVNFDISAGKRFMVGRPREAANLEFRADLFNALNHPQFADPGTTFGSSTFGTFTGATITNPRIIQFALRYSF